MFMRVDAILNSRHITPIFSILFDLADLRSGNILVDDFLVVILEHHVSIRPLHLRTGWRGGE